MKTDGLVYSQPLYVPQLTVAGGVHNTLFSATEHDSVYAFDADSGALLWHVSLFDTAHGAIAGATPEQSTCGEVSPELGITGTPVIDPATQTMYLAAKTTENGLPVYRLHAIDITSGNERPNSPVVIQAKVTNKSGTLTFDPKYHRQRPGLLLLHGVVYLAFGAICDTTPWHGWMFAYNATTLAKTSVYVTTPDGNGGGIWMSGAGLAAEVPDPVGHPYGRAFFSTGNGDFDGVTNYSDSNQRFDLANGVITFSDSFTPSNQAALTASDLDVSSGGMVLLPDQPGPHPHLLFQAGKTAAYLVDRDNMGGYHPVDAIVQEVQGIGGLWGVPAYWNGNIYYWGKQDVLRQYALNNGTLSPVAVGVQVLGLGSTRYPAGTSPSISANGNTNGVLWSVDWDANVFYAHDASNVSKTLYSLPLSSSVKFTTPTIANGKVYLGGYSKISVFGLIANVPDFSLAASPPTLTMGSTASASTNVNVSPVNSFAGNVTLTLGSLPTGVNAQLSASSVPLSKGAVTLTVTTTALASSTVPVTVTGTAATGQHTLVVNVIVPQAAKPAFSPGQGTYTSVQNVSLADATPGAVIYYTVDGSIPTTSSPVYSSPIPVSANLTIKAVAISPTTALSSVVTEVYTINLQAASPVFAPPPGTYGAPQAVTLTDVTPGAVIHYTLDGSRPTASSAVYTGPIPVSSATTIQALATASGYTASLVASGTYTINGSVATPTLSPLPGSFSAPQTVTIADSTAGAVIHYTVDGSTPTAASPVYTAAIPVNATTTIQALATATGLTASAVVGGTYTINLAQAAAPTFAPAPGSYASAQSVTLTDSTAGAVIHYTIDGSTPTAASPVYTVAIPVSATATVKALATASGFSPSAVANGTYAINGSAAPPTLSPAPGSYNSNVTVTLADATPGVVIHYTLDGSVPTVNSPVYSAALTLNATATVNALATATGFTSSSVSSGTYTITLAAAAPPTFTPVPGTYAAAQSVTLADSTPGASIHYTLDGSTPSVTSPTYSQPISVASTATVKALAVAAGFATSTVASGTYTIMPFLTVALTSPSAGATFTAPATVSLTATASTSIGTITRVEFYNGTTLLGQSATAPYSYQWTSVPAGSYSLSAIAYGSTGVSTMSSLVNISVQSSGTNSPPPAAQWNLDSAASGITPDATAGHNDATLTGGYSFVTGKIDNAIQFNPATGGALTKTAPFNSTGSFSVATWVYLTGNTNPQGFICQPATTGSTFFLELGIPVNGKLVFDFDLFPQDSPTAADSIAVGVTPALPNTWYHIVGVYDAVNRQASIYVNGALESKVSSFPGFANSGGLAFGYSKWQGGRVQPTDGRMDDVRAYGVALTSAQVLALYQGH